MDSKSYIGIDIACKKFDAALYREGAKPLHKVFENTPKGFKSLLVWLKQHPGMHFTMEATGIYWEELAYFLHEHNCTVSVVNPKCIKAYGVGQNLRSKTDKIDAGLIARYAAKEHPAPWQPPKAAERALLLKLRQLDHLKTAEQKERVRIGMMRDQDSINSARRMADFIREEINRMEKVIEETICTDEELSHNAKLLSDIPGIGAKSIPWLLAYLGNGTRFKNGKAAAAFAGLTPMLHQSGSSVCSKTHISKIGHSDLRKVLYMPAMVYSFGHCKNRVYRGFVGRLKANGKAKMEIIVALMRKLVVIAQSVLQNQTPFNANLHDKSFCNA